MRTAFATVPLLAGVLIFAGAAAPASAATIPVGDVLYGYNSSSGGLYVVAADASTTLIGTGGGPAENWGFDFSKTRGLFYMFRDTSPCELWSVDPVTGVSTLVAPFFITGDPTVISNCDGFDVDNAGVARMSWGDNNLSVVNLDTGELTGTVPMLLGGNPFDAIGLLATNPVTGELYVFSYSGNVAIVTNKTTGALGAAFTLGSLLNGGDFDSSGELWLSDGVSLYTIDVSAGDPPATFASQGSFPEVGGTFAIAFIRPAAEVSEGPVLAATGINDPSPLVAGAAIAAVAGLVLLGSTALRSRRRASA